MEQCTELEVQRLLELVPEWRRRKALDFKHVLGQYTSLKSYVMLQGLLVEHGIVLEGVLPDFEYGAHGKPRLRNIGSVHFSLSHTRRAIAVAIGDHPVGVDVEGFRLPSDQLLKYTLNTKELMRVRKAEHPEQEFALLWTQKEALFKYTGLGINSSIKELLTQMPRSAIMESSLNAEKGYALTVVRSKD